MPNLDGGHYFLTVLAPIRTGVMTDPVVGRTRSHRQLLAQKLALIPTGRQTAASPPDAWPSPLARNTLNHLARFVIIDGPAFNGRVSGDTILDLLRKTNPLTPQPVDQLSTPYLVFAADLDGQTGADPLGAYTAALWTTMRRDLEEIFGHCDGFDGIETPEAFDAFIRRCQVETTMPFNDYWPDGLKASDLSLPLAPLIVVAAVAAGWLAATIAHGVLALTGATGGLADVCAAAARWAWLALPALLALAGLCIYGLYRAVMGAGARPFPTAPGSDLPTVLKALFLQQQFTRFAIEAQGLDDATLHARFGGFLGAVRPGEDAPTQPAGEIRAPEVEWLR
jgi:hypothetical protein